MKQLHDSTDSTVRREIDAFIESLDTHLVTVAPALRADILKETRVDLEEHINEVRNRPELHGASIYSVLDTVFFEWDDPAILGMEHTSKAIRDYRSLADYAYCSSVMGLMCFILCVTFESNPLVPATLALAQIASIISVTIVPITVGHCIGKLIAASSMKLPKRPIALEAIGISLMCQVLSAGFFATIAARSANWKVYLPTSLLSVYGMTDARGNFIRLDVCIAATLLALFVTICTVAVSAKRYRNQPILAS